MARCGGSGWWSICSLSSPTVPGRRCRMRAGVLERNQARRLWSAVAGLWVVEAWSGWWRPAYRYGAAGPKERRVSSLYIRASDATFVLTGTLTVLLKVTDDQRGPIAGVPEIPFRGRQCCGF
jgi:hypothetical protein